jgi:signal transduction histidine kinase
MTESYWARGSESSVSRGSAPLMVAEPSTVLARELLRQLLPDVDPDKLVLALLAERDTPAAQAGEPQAFDSDEQMANRELQRVRSTFALGKSARALQHAFSNPLTALLAEAQLLELEPLAQEHRAALHRMVSLARRLMVLLRRLGDSGEEREG